MDLLQVGELELHIQHRHSDGTWQDLEPRRHSPADHDPEREWADGTIYACTACDELVRVAVREKDDDEAR